MKRLSILWILVAVGLALAACAPAAAPTPTPDAVATETAIASRVFATQTAAAPTATNTPPATNTPRPTDTPRPASTRTPASAVAPASAPVAAATPAPEVVLTSTVESGWVLYQMTTSRFALALPPGWQRLDLSPDGLQTSAAIVGDLNPKFASVVSSQALRQMVASGVKFYAMDVTPQGLAGRFPASVNVMKMDAGVALPLDSLVPAMLSQIQAMADADVPVTHRRLAFNGVQAEEFKYTVTMAIPMGEPVRLVTSQYMIMDGTMVYAVTLGAPREVSDTYDPVILKIAQSFRLLK